MNFRVRVAGPTPKLALTGAAGGGDVAQKVKGSRVCWFDDGSHETAVYDRYALRPGDEIAGPAIIEERESTTVVGPTDSMTVDEGLNLEVRIGAVTAADAVITAEMSRAEAVARIEGDPIGLEIMWSRLMNVVEEMWQTVCRTAFSLVIAEAQDFACEILDPDGETLAHRPRAMPVFNLTLPRAVKALLEHYPADTLKPGDVLITNDPWLCAGHLFDIAIVTPAFLDGRVVGLMGTVGHVSDIGGTKDPLHAREIYEEGMQIPPMKIFEEGRPNQTLIDLIGKNVRNGEQVLGDVFSFVAANALGAERLVAFMRDYGMQDLGALAAVVQGLSEKAMRDAIRAMPDGKYRSVITNNPLGEMIRYPVLVRVEGDAHHRRLRRGAAAAAAGRPELHAELHGGARDLSDEVHADADGARQRRLLQAVHGHGAGRVDPEPDLSGLGEPAHADGVVPGAEHLRGAGAGGAGQGAVLHRAAGGGEHLRAEPGRAVLLGHAVLRRRAGRLGPQATGSRRCCGRPRRRIPRSS